MDASTQQRAALRQTRELPTISPAWGTRGSRRIGPGTYVSTRSADRVVQEVPDVDARDNPRLADVLKDLAMAILTDTSLKADLERLARLACRLIDACSGASISMLIDGEPSTVATTDRVTLELDMVQYDNDEGPCVAALRGGDAIRIGFLPNDERFPHFAVGAADRRVLSVLSTPAIDHGTIVGSLNVYSRQAEAFERQAHDIALVIAAEVANAVVKSFALGTAHNARDMIQEQHDETVLFSQAQGVLMAVHDCSSAQARDLIERAAGSNGERLITTAERILATARQEIDASSAQDGHR
jgi:GAF domain-containing protein